MHDNQRNNTTAESAKASQGTVVNYSCDFDIDSYIPYRLVQTQLWMHSVINPENTPDAQAIAVLSKTEFRVITLIALKGPIAPSDIAANVGLDRAVATRCLSSLRRKGLIVTHRSEIDQRSKSASLTQTGVNFCDQVIPIMQNFGRYLDDALTSTEKEALLNILGKLLASSHSYPTG